MKIASLSFCKALQFIIMHHNTKFGNKMFGSSGDIWINIDISTLHCNLDLKCSNPIFPHDALAYDNLSSDHVWLPKNQQFRRYSSQSNILIIWALAVTLTLKTANNFCFAWHSGSFCSITIPSLVTKCFVVQKITPDKYSLTFLTFGVTLTLSAVIQFFRRTLWLIMLYYHSEFGCNRTSSLEDIVEIVIFWLYKPSLWPWHWR